MLLYLSGSCRSSLTQSHSAWPARSYYPSLLQHIAGCCSSSGQSSGTWPEKQTKIQNIVFSAFFTQQLLDCILSVLTASPSLHFQLPLSMGFLRFSPIQNQCCSWSSDSLWATLSSSSPLSSYYITSRLVRRSHPPKGLVEDLQNKVLLLRAADTQQVGSMPPTEEVSLQPAQLLLQLGGMEHLRW